MAHSPPPPPAGIKILGSIIPMGDLTLWHGPPRGVMHESMHALSTEYAWLQAGMHVSRF